ncbi:Protein alcS, partial [Tolypocladium paradoxum]
MSEEEGRIQKNGGYDEDRMETVRSATNVSMSPELFEKLYLSPQNRIKGELRQTFGNPTPMCRLGRFRAFLDPVVDGPHGMARRRRQRRGKHASLPLTPARPWLPSLTIPSAQRRGGILMTLCGILEWILGNTFPAVVFTVFGTFWLAYGGTLNPSFAAFASYAPPDATTPAEGLTTPGFNASLAYWFLFMGVISFVFLICSLRTNVCFFVIFLTLTIAFGLLTGAFLANAADYTGNANLAKKLVVVGNNTTHLRHNALDMLTLNQGAGASTFVTCWAGWYILLAVLLAAVDFPIQIPVGDLSTI